MTTNQRGCVTLIGVLIFAAVFCVGVPLVLLPSFRTATTLPVITVPPEYYREDWPGWNIPVFGFNEIVNTQGAALLATIIVLLIALRARQLSNG
ncbi:MAG: hypothetical protein MUE40_03485, partial [Anaerolineae bacterium]|nr:hypothetical protein [Anaerolineae bacterium]